MIGPGHAREDPMREIMAGFAAEEQERAKNLVQAQLSGVRQIAASLADLEGYKHVIWFSEGFSAGLFKDGALPDAGMIHSLKMMAEPFQAAGAFIHTVDLGVVGNDVISLDDRSAPSYDNGASTLPPWTFSNGASTPTSVRRFDDSRDETLFMFAAQTGGQFLHWTNDFAAALGDLSAIVSTGYRLGFKPVDPHKGANAIDVKVKNLPRGATLSFRKGFSSAPESSDAGDGLLLADIIQNDIPQSGTPLAFSFTKRPFIDVIVPARQLAREHGAIPEATIMLYIFDDKGAAVDYREKKISIPATPAADIVIRHKLALPPGSYVAKSLLRIGKSIGFAKVAFAIAERN